MVNLFGSTPPPVDTVWEALKSRNVKVNTYARSTWTGKEKQVDTSISLDAVDQASDDYHAGSQSEFVIVSGDGDMHPAVLRIMKRGFPVQVWSWKNALAKVYTREREELLQVHLLDDHLEEIGFRETRFRLERDAINPHSTVVLDPLPKADAINAYFAALTVPSFRYVCPTVRAGASGEDLVIIPAAGSMEHTALEDLHQSHKAKLGAQGLRVLTYFEYCQHYLKNSVKDDLAISSHFHEVDPPAEDILDSRTDLVDADKQYRAASEEADRNSFSFTTVNRRSEQQKKRFSQGEWKSRTVCQWGPYCKKILECRFGHTQAQKDGFKVKGPQVARKFRMCLNLQTCTLGTTCRFAHTKAEMLCPTCDKRGAGHEMEACPKKG